MRSHVGQEEWAVIRKLSPEERAALLKLGGKGPGDDFDQLAMSKLFTLELVEVRSTDRRLVLTDAGRELYRELAGDLS